jgi:phosphatidylglycerophosphate synthase
MTTQVWLAALPNGLSLARLILGVGFPWMPAPWRLPVVVVAALTDLLDGVSSRRLHVASTFGRILDPVADKVFIVAVLITLWREDLLALWELGLLGLRDLVVLAGVGWVLARGNGGAIRTMTPRPLGKVTTAMQFAYFLGLLIGQQRMLFLFFSTVLCSGLSALDYLRFYSSLFYRRSPGEERPCDKMVSGCETGEEKVSP